MGILCKFDKNRGTYSVYHVKIFINIYFYFTTLLQMTAKKNVLDTISLRLRVSFYQLQTTSQLQ